MPRSTFSRTTVLLLVGYALYVAGVWVFGVAPGELAYEGARVVALNEPLDEASVWVRADDDWMVAQTGAQTFAIVDLESFDAGAASSEPRTFEARGRLLAAVRHGPWIDVVTAEDDRRRAYRVRVEDGPAESLAEEPDLLWTASEGPWGHGLVDALVERTWGVHVADEPGVVSGDFVVLRVGGAGRLDDEHRWVVRPSATPDDLLVLDAFSSEPLQHLDTYRLDLVRPAPGLPGFLLIEADLPAVLVCDPEERRCMARSLHIRTGTHPIVELDHRYAVHRLAACTPSELYLYAGDPRGEAIVLAGRTALLAPCENLVIVDETTVIVGDGLGQSLAYRFLEDEDDG